jgi:hypothetical protein
MKKILALTIGFLLLSGIYSCKREGCTDSSSKNHSSKAKKDDGTCEFESRTSFWFNQNVSNFLTNYGVTTLHVYIDDISVGEIDVADWETGPDCGGNNLTVTNKYTGENAKTYKYEGRAQNGTLHFQGTFTASPNECLAVELKW